MAKKTVSKRKSGKRPKAAASKRKTAPKRGRKKTAAKVTAVLPTLPPDFKIAVGRGARLLMERLPTLPKSVRINVGRGAATRRKK